MTVSNTQLKDSGVREQMSTGSQRDTQVGKPRPELIPPSFLVKLAMHYGNGASKYNSNNWRKGQPISRYLASFERHMLAFRCGRTDEPHLVAAVWNLIAIDWTIDAISTGRLPSELDDRSEDERANNPYGEALYRLVEQNAAAVRLQLNQKNERTEAS